LLLLYSSRCTLYALASFRAYLEKTWPLSSFVAQKSLSSSLQGLLTQTHPTVTIDMAAEDTAELGTSRPAGRGRQAKTAADNCPALATTAAQSDNPPSTVPRSTEELVASISSATDADDEASDSYPANSPEYRPRSPGIASARMASSPARECVVVDERQQT
jgi:hypothetical protein